MAIQTWIPLAKGMPAITCPPICAWVRHHTCPNRVQFTVATAGDIGITARPIARHVYQQSRGESRIIIHKPGKTKGFFTAVEVQSVELGRNERRERVFILNPGNMGTIKSSFSVGISWVFLFVKKAVYWRE